MAEVNEQVQALTARLAELKSTKGGMSEEDRKREMRKTRKALRDMGAGVSGRDQNYGGEPRAPKEKSQRQPRAPRDPDAAANRRAERRLSRMKVTEEIRPVILDSPVPSETFITLDEAGIADKRGSDILYNIAGYSFPQLEGLTPVNLATSSIEKFEARWSKKPEWYTTLRQGKIEYLVLGPAR